MKIEEIRSKNDSELRLALDGLTQELFDLRFKSTTSGIQSTAAIRTARRSIARIKTVLHERQHGVRGAQEVQA